MRFGFVRVEIENHTFESVISSRAVVPPVEVMDVTAAVARWTSFDLTRRCS
jgi:hypothetical protein